jgi:hypothetical protein
VIEFYYRYEDVQYAAPLDEFDNPQGPGRLAVELREYQVVKRTPKGVWLSLYGDRRFVLNSATRRFACPTKAEAQESFLARKKRQISIHQGSIKRAERAMAIVTKGELEL